MVLIVAISTRNATELSVNKFISNVICFTLKCLLSLNQWRLRYNTKKYSTGCPDTWVLHWAPPAARCYRWEGQFSSLSLTTYLLTSQWLSTILALEADLESGWSLISAPALTESDIWGRSFNSSDSLFHQLLIEILKYWFRVLFVCLFVWDPK